MVSNGHTTNGGLAVQSEEVEDQPQQQPVTKTRTPPVKAPWIEELEKRNHDKRTSSMAGVSQEKPAVPPAKPPSLAKPAAAASTVTNTKPANSASQTPSLSSVAVHKSPTNNPSVRSASSSVESPVAIKAPLPSSPPVGPSSGVKQPLAATGTNTGSPVGASNKQAINEPGLTILSKHAPVKEEIGKSISRQSSESSTTGLAVTPSVINRTTNSDSMQQEIQSLRQRVVTLEATVENLQEVVETLKKTIDDERRAKTNGASSKITPLIQI